MAIIPVTCDPRGTLKRVPIHKLQAFQGNLKELRQAQFDQLAASIEQFGFFAPVFVWAGKNLILDGHQRLFVCREKGWEIEGGVPVVEIEAASKKEAAEKLLLFSSAYGRVTQRGLRKFQEQHQIDVAQFGLADFPEFDLLGVLGRQQTKDTALETGKGIRPKYDRAENGFYACQIGHFAFLIEEAQMEQMIAALPPICLQDVAQGRSELLGRLKIED